MFPCASDLQSARAQLQFLEDVGISVSRPFLSPGVWGFGAGGLIFSDLHGDAPHHHIVISLLLVDFRLVCATPAKE
eukprot:5555808-Amphidinium_carterae.1